MSDETHVVLNVPGISCAHCKRAIEDAVAGLDGVAGVEVDVGARSVDVRFHAERLSLDRIEEAVAAEGYEVAGTHVFED